MTALLHQRFFLKNAAIKTPRLLKNIHYWLCNSKHFQQASKTTHHQQSCWQVIHHHALCRSVLLIAKTHNPAFFFSYSSGCKPWRRLLVWIINVSIQQNWKLQDGFTWNSGRWGIKQRRTPGNLTGISIKGDFQLSRRQRLFSSDPRASGFIKVTHTWRHFNLLNI